MCTFFTSFIYFYLMYKLQTIHISAFQIAIMSYDLNKLGNKLNGKCGKSETLGPQLFSCYTQALQLALGFLTSCFPRTHYLTVMYTITLCCFVYACTSNTKLAARAGLLC